MLKEVVVNYYKQLSHHSNARTKQNHERPQSEELFLGPRCDIGTCRVLIIIPRNSSPTGRSP